MRSNELGLDDRAKIMECETKMKYLENEFTNKNNYLTKKYMCRSNNSNLMKYSHNDM